MRHWPRHALTSVIGREGGANAKKDFKKGVQHGAGFSREYRMDVRLEKREADERIIIPGQDIERIAEALGELERQESRYNMVRHNCSTVVAAMLQIGSGRMPTFQPKFLITQPGIPFLVQLRLRLQYLGNSIAMWTPEAVGLYARQLAASMRADT